MEAKPGGAVAGTPLTLPEQGGVVWVLTGRIGLGIMLEFVQQVSILGALAGCMMRAAGFDAGVLFFLIGGMEGVVPHQGTKDTNEQDIRQQRCDDTGIKHGYKGLIIQI